MDYETFNGWIIAAGMLSFWAYNLVAGLICGDFYFSIFMGIVLTLFAIAQGIITRGRLGVAYFGLYMLCIYIMFDSVHKPAFQKLQTLPAWSPNAVDDSEQGD